MLVHFNAISVVKFEGQIHYVKVRRLVLRPFVHVYCVEMTLPRDDILFVCRVLRALRGRCDLE